MISDDFVDFQEPAGEFYQDNNKGQGPTELPEPETRNLPELDKILQVNRAGINTSNPKP